MQLSPNGQYLNLLFEGLNNEILPELKSSKAKNTAATLSVVLAELIKREHVTGQLLENSISEGIALLRRMDNAIGSVPASQYQPMEADVSELIQQHGSITSRIQQRCEALLRREGRFDHLVAEAAQWEHSFYRINAEYNPEPGSYRQQLPPPLSASELCSFANDEALWGSDVDKVSIEHHSTRLGRIHYSAEFTLKNGGVETTWMHAETAPMLIRRGAFAVDNEYALLKAISSAQYPVPAPLALARDWGEYSRNFCLTKADDGDASMASALENASKVDAQALVLAMAEALARLHSLPLSSFQSYARAYESPALLTDSVTECYTHMVGGWQNHMASGEQLDSPFLTWQLNWLQRNIPHSTRPAVLLHGEFTPENLLMRDGTVHAVINWQASGFGAPEQDLAAVQTTVEQYMPWKQFIAHYVEAGGKQPDEEWIRYGTVYSLFSRSLAANRASWFFQQGMGQDADTPQYELVAMESMMDRAIRAASAV